MELMMARGLKVKIKNKSRAEIDAIRRQRGCESKRVYLSESDAWFGARNTKIEYGHKLMPYHCGFCGWWHNRTKPTPRFQP
jgi:hypothetical protein